MKKAFFSKCIWITKLTVLSAGIFFALFCEAAVEKEIFIYTQAPPKNEKTMFDQIFNVELTKEFRRTYVDRFGTIDTAMVNYYDPKYAQFEDDNRLGYVNEANAIDARRHYGEYMMRRLLEWHADHYLKDDPQIRPLYEAKERMSKAEVNINPQTKMEVQYSVAGNTLDLNFQNPYIDSKLTIYINNENKILLGKQLTKHTRLNFTATTNDGISTVELVHSMKGNLSVNVVSSTFYKNQGSSPRETHTSIGMTDSF